MVITILIILEIMKMKIFEVEISEKMELEIELIIEMMKILKLEVVRLFIRKLL
jgi:hypothetical protein